MSQRNENTSEHNQDEGDFSSSKSNEDPGSMLRLQTPKRSSYVILAMFALMLYSSWSVYHYQYQRLPMPLTAEQAGKRGFSEIEAVKHVKTSTEFGPHSVGFDALDLAVQ
ncbi:hypothetical protein Ancab_023535, partial [Ancistrocladus abbreviatus]